MYYYVSTIVIIFIIFIICLYKLLLIIIYVNYIEKPTCDKYRNTFLYLIYRINGY